MVVKFTQKELNCKYCYFTIIYLYVVKSTIVVSTNGSISIEKNSCVRMFFSFPSCHWLKSWGHFP